MAVCHSFPSKRERGEDRVVFFFCGCLALFFWGGGSLSICFIFLLEEHYEGLKRGVMKGMGERFEARHLGLLV